MTAAASPSFRSAIYSGQVVHKRLTPRHNAFTYRVFALALDVDEIPDIAETLRMFGHNQRRLVSFYDKDYGRGGDGTVSAHIRSTLMEAGLQAACNRIVLLCYPRLLGFVFNPLSVYFCYGTADQLKAVVYEVSNTFRERTSYIIPVQPTDGTALNVSSVHQTCAKEMYVSPFTPRAAQYSFHVAPPRDEVVVGVSLRDQNGPLLKTHFRGARIPLTDRSLAAMVARHPLMTAKVVGGIHLEAARLWFKGVPLVKRHTSGRHTISVIQPTVNPANTTLPPVTLPGSLNA
jgi:uncharacterized protein